MNEIDNIFINSKIGSEIACFIYPHKNVKYFLNKNKVKFLAYIIFKYIYAQLICSFTD